MPAGFEKIFASITLAVNNFITGDRPIKNVTQWCKQASCREKMKSSLRVVLPEDFSQYMTDKNSLKAEKKSAAETQRISFEVDATTKILSFSGETWKEFTPTPEN